ncbi:FHA domain-containing protein [Isoptericola chiayiensis]|uniref:FHA domain-containing protein n=1 Tax=Isoptericola chiayiensis TaxID=579446 RepID=A0ABP8YEP1_9MICO|nr:FHA domain-containing protein [Isoptericola chiayiensis]NOV99994.1 pSer/pThr/pTyr-binding forkhead associated (FHA) protein [Isoptericola chiayiensis]
MTDPRALPPREAGVDTTAHLGRVAASGEEQTPRIPLTAEEAAAVSALPRHSALLVVQYGSGAVGERFLLDQDRTVAGRSERADIFLDDVTVSRKHAEFQRDGDRFVVRDIGSLNGTYVNRDRIDAVVLHTGDEVQIGKFRMSFHASPQAPQDPQAPAS